MKYNNSYNHDYNKNDIKHPFIIALISIIIMLPSIFVLNSLYERSKEEIDMNYKIIHAIIHDKHIDKGYRNSTYYGVTASSPDGHTETYYISKNQYNSLNIGDTITIYNYKNYYDDSLYNLICSNAGIIYTIFEFILACSAGYSIGFIIIGLFQSLKKLIHCQKTTYYR